uniref:ATP synthase F0 subunit 8 n=1 Tax=Helorus sp. ZJUH_2016017 TaxID=2491159 RepID=A0A3Q8UA25_9HYME|nr:ATP synthase F0 subunit 8 [Helorus sp. ZJUH_2016017]
MPQMSQMNWINLMIFTMISLFLMISNIYFFPIKKILNLNKKMKKNFYLKW